MYVLSNFEFLNKHWRERFSRDLDLRYLNSTPSQMEFDVLPQDRGSHCTYNRGCRPLSFVDNASQFKNSA